jgi:hypothetical protein
MKQGILVSRVSDPVRTALWVVVFAVLATSLGFGQVKLNTWTSPSQGQAGATQVTATGSAFPTGTINASSVTVSVGSTCMGTALATTTASKVTKLIGTSYKVQFLIPASLTQATDQVWINGSTTGGTKFSSTNCSSMKVLPPVTTLSSCLPSSSLGVLLPASGTGNVTAYVPNGAWDSSGTGIQVVPLEGSGTVGSVSTVNAVNSCASNSATGQSVCTANNTDVYLLTGSTLNKTLTSGATTFAGFSGGSCENCGVSINALTNQAVLTIGISGSPTASGLQILNLSSNTFGTPFSASNIVSENVQWDPVRNLILSPGENGIYDLFDTSTSTLKEYGMSVGGVLDSAAEDCTTGIALSTSEFTGNLFISDLTQAKLTSGSPGTWTAPGQTVNFPEFDNFSAGTSGMAVAPGSHNAIVAGEFGGNQFGVVVLPSTSGSGTPSFGDYAAATVPNTPDGFTWSQGLDPHTITAYVSPNNARPYGVMANSPPPTWLVVVDLQALLSAPRISGTHTVDPTYDLVANGVVRFVATH